tara:strand:- start:970 stop:1422 length:453 start_codon:yes stop_codon:yes gene_type:complete
MNILNIKKIEFFIYKNIYLIYKKKMFLNLFKQKYNNLYSKLNSINVEISNVQSFYDIEHKISKILYYNNIKYKTIRCKKKIILNINLNNDIFDNILLKLNEFNENYYHYNNFHLKDLFKIINLTVKNSEEYILQINKDLSNIKYDVNHHE